MPEVAPFGSLTATVRHAVPFQVSASGPPAPFSALWSKPTAMQFLAVTQDTLSSSRAPGGEAADADRTPVAAVRPSTVTAAISADAIVLWFNSAPGVQVVLHGGRARTVFALSATYACGRRQGQSVIDIAVTTNAAWALTRLGVVGLTCADRLGD